MAIFTDVVTIYNKISDSEWERTVVSGVLWTIAGSGSCSGTGGSDGGGVMGPFSIGCISGS